MVANEDNYNFVFPLMGHNLPLNLTMTHSPLHSHPFSDENKNLIELYFNGLFDFAANGYEVLDITDYPPRIENSHSN